MTSGRKEADHENRPVVRRLPAFELMEIRAGVVVTTAEDKPRIVYWHRELPPSDAEAVGEHIVEATSARVSSLVAHRDELWDRSRSDLSVHAGELIAQEVRRLGGRYAHVLQEVIEPRHNDATAEAWLYGRYTYMLYR